MLIKFGKKIFYSFSIIFLVVAVKFQSGKIYDFLIVKKYIDNASYLGKLTPQQISEIKNKTFFSLLNTDGLALIGLIISLITMISLRWYYVRKAFNLILLNTNVANISYSLEINFESSEFSSIEDVKKVFFDTAGNFKKFKTKNFNFISENKNSYKFNFRQMASNCEIKLMDKIPLEDDEDEFLYKWKFEINGVINFRTLNRNIKFLTNGFLEKLQEKDVKVKKINLLVSKEDTEFSIIDKGFFERIKIYEILSSRVTIDTCTTAKIELDSSKGLTLYSRNKGDFLNALEDFKFLLIS